MGGAGGERRGTHWMVFVNWSTVVEWKRNSTAASSEGSGHPYQYSSDNPRFLDIERGDVLWIVTTPRFDKRGRPSRRGRARPPAVMARLRVRGTCCNRGVERHREAPVCAGKLPFCDESTFVPGGVHPASDAWSIVVVGAGDAAGADRDPLNVTYPPLYNIFGALDRLEFQTGDGPTRLDGYLEFVESGEYLDQATRPGPYGRFGQRFRNLRKLTPGAADVMDALHTRAIEGRLVFFSYKWDDVSRIAERMGQTRGQWVADLNRELDRAGYSSWLDHHQILAEQDMGGLLDEVLSDAVRQSVVFVALLTEGYGDGWTRREWEIAHEQSERRGRRGRLLPVVLDCGGDAARLEPSPDISQTVMGPLKPTTVVNAIDAAVQHSG